ncbi:MAG: hypothetical protein U0K68_01770 [Agathobacter sp.]|nr:hypothetical protein [Agathobacter sp.]
MSTIHNLPSQRIPDSKKTDSWCKKHLDWADGRTYFNYSPVRNSVRHKKINYDLVNGILHMQDLGLIVNPENLDAGFIPEKIHHYPIINKSLNVLRGEETKRLFDYRVVITNPNAISEMEEAKKEAIMAQLQQAISNTAQSEQEYEAEIQKISDYYKYQYQDIREIRANALLNHYVKEYNMPLMFNEGMADGMIVGEEIYLCDIVGGEPVIERLDPLKVRIFKSGYSNKIEDADIIVIEDYWSPGKIIDVYGDSLTAKEVDKIENLSFGSDNSDGTDSYDPTWAYSSDNMAGTTFVGEEGIQVENLFSADESDALLPYDMAGNIKVVRIFWKSLRRIKKVKSYDPLTGEEIYTFHTDKYQTNKDLGEEEQVFYINEAWEGTKIGKDIYVNMRPRAIQYNRMDNPSRCHFGIIGSIYNINNAAPLSFVDMMKHYNYLYDVIHDRLNKLIARNWGMIIQLDLAKVPEEWSIDKWMYYAKTNGIAVIDSFKEGNVGASTGVLAGGMNNASSGVINAELGNSIQQYINLLEYIKQEMTEVVGISKQREGQISNRETVGGVERATLQSSHITEWVFAIHNDVKKRALECFLETAKIAFRGRTKKFNYILPDYTIKAIDLDGDVFAEADYGLVIDSNSQAQELHAKLDTLAQAALQNQTLSFSTIMKLYNSASLAEKQRMIEEDERIIQERQAQAQQQQMQHEQQLEQAKLQEKQMEMQHEDQLNQRDNETKILIASMQAEAKLMDESSDGIQPEYSQEAKEKLLESMRQFDARLALDKDRLAFEERKHKDDIAVKKQQIHSRKSTTSK